MVNTLKFNLKISDSFNFYSDINYFQQIFVVLFLLTINYSLNKIRKKESEFTFTGTFLKFENLKFMRVRFLKIKFLKVFKEI